MEFYTWISLVEGVMIIFLLSFEIYWLKRMYNMLSRLPSSEQFNSLIDKLIQNIGVVMSSVKDIVGVFFKKG